MTVPGRTDAARLLLTLDPPRWFLRHSRAVAEIAAWLAARTAERGTALDRRLVEAAALLHDVDKLLSDADPASGLPHGEGSAAWLAARGLPELEPAVANHPVTRLADGDRFRRWQSSAGREAQIVAYADKRAGQRLQSMAARFAAWERRFPPGGDGWPAAMRSAILARADRLEEAVCRAAGVRPEDVRRLPWTGTALARAQEHQTP
ncbi:MAG TPA: HD domain-containing protein [Vitreimonas sp.]|nr:HD domain-containing protein [Vitreimonas sp.]